jgi:hypothetical protein
MAIDFFFPDSVPSSNYSSTVGMDNFPNSKSLPTMITAEELEKGSTQNL